jgi:hypothetical protein
VNGEHPLRARGVPGELLSSDRSILAMLGISSHDPTGFPSAYGPRLVGDDPHTA